MSLKLLVSVGEMRDMLRIKHDQLDTELEMLKNAFLADIAMCGVMVIPNEDNLAKACLRLYLRWQENYNGEADRYKSAYEHMKIAMSLAEEYREQVDL